jgi:hypothetical protein
LSISLARSQPYRELRLLLLGKACGQLTISDLTLP